MTQINVNIRMDETLKQEFSHLCGELGMNMSTAFTVFAKKAVREKRIPFELSLDVPNAETIAAIDDVNNKRNLVGPFHSISDLMEDLNA